MVSSPILARVSQSQGREASSVVAGASMAVVCRACNNLLPGFHSLVAYHPCEPSDHPSTVVVVMATEASIPHVEAQVELTVVKLLVLLVQVTRLPLQMLKVRLHVDPSEPFAVDEQSFVVAAAASFAFAFDGGTAFAAFVAFDVDLVEAA